ncbi:MAG: DUF4388 domain-containing protein, partial [Nitrospiria bacterium]
MSAAPFPSSGRLRNLRLPNILQIMWQEEKTGVLNLFRNDLNKSIYLQNGEMIFATSHYPDDRLGEVLLKAGKIRYKEYERSVELLKKTGKRQGTILVEEGFITPKDLFEGVIFQVKEIILSLFTWIDGEYKFKEGPLPTEEVITLDISTATLILEGIKRIRDWNRLLKDLPPPDSFIKASEDPPRLSKMIQRSPATQALIQLADGRKTLYDILIASDMHSLECAQVLYYLLTVHILKTVTPPASETP